MLQVRSPGMVLRNKGRWLQPSLCSVTAEQSLSLASWGWPLQTFMTLVGSEAWCPVRQTYFLKKNEYTALQ